MLFCGREGQWGDLSFLSTKCALGYCELLGDKAVGNLKTQGEGGVHAYLEQALRGTRAAAMDKQDSI